MDDGIDKLLEIISDVGNAALMGGDAMLRRLGFPDPEIAKAGLRLYIDAVREVGEQEWYGDLPAELRASFDMARSQAALMLAFFAGMDQVDAELERAMA